MIEDNGAGFAIDQQSLFPERRSLQMDQEYGGQGDSEFTPNLASSTGRYRSHGLALHSTMMAVVGGYLAVESEPGQHTRVTLEVPESAWQS